MAAPARFRRILVADDEPVVLELFRRCLSEAGYQVDTAPSAERARDMLEERLYDAVICDYSFPGMSGIQLLDFVRQYDRDLPFIIVTGYAGTVRCAVDAMKRGAFDYLEKPFEPEELVIVTQRALEHAKLASDLRHMRAEFTRAAGVENIIGRSKVMRDLFDLVRRVAPSNSTILLQGESGTGKELFARAIHQLSARRDGPFLALNCAVLPETLLESEL
ncbi:MAG: sigma-54-dependent Fis family transcriptional regulator, partial [Planctomycetes bacterium]|nr:sigma-54-dependent Fis family transcriptional regulator [Planctomycetota bacterium]